MAMRLFYEKLSWQEPEAVFAFLFAHKDNIFWLDSSRSEKDLARFSYMGIGKDKRLKIKDLIIHKPLIINHKSEAPFLFHGGYIGYITYEGKSTWLYISRFLVFDHWEKVVYIVGIGEKKEAEKYFKEIKEKLNSQKTQIEFSLPAPIQSRSENQKIRKSDNQTVRQSDTLIHRVQSESYPKILNFHLSRSHKQYLKDIALCKEYLCKGESYQICLTNQININLSEDSFNLYRILRKKSPVPYSAFIHHGDTSIICASPEKFLSVDKEGWVETKPIKGTSNRSQNKKEDKLLAKNLLASVKNRAENIMITDLLRNDLGKVCEIGSVSVPKLLAVESYKSVHHLVSTIRGKLRKDISVLDCIKACFPGGSMTGAPKLRTMEILKQVEKEPRRIYSGILGFLSIDGTAEFNIIIRTIIKKGNNLSIGTGGAILIDSDPEQEYEEMLLKARPLLESITEVTGAKGYTIR